MQFIVRLLGTTLVLLTYAAAGTAWAASPALPYGINTHLPSSALLDRVAAAGIAWIRVDFNWYDLQPARDRYDWTLADAVVHDARAGGLNVYATLSYTPAWATAGRGGTPPPPAQLRRLVQLRLRDRQPLPGAGAALGDVERAQRRRVLVRQCGAIPPDHPGGRRAGCAGCPGRLRVWPGAGDAGRLVGVVLPDPGCLGATEHKTRLRQTLDPNVPNQRPF
jgi:hypothetical protein